MYRVIYLFYLFLDPFPDMFEFVYVLISLYKQVCDRENICDFEQYYSFTSIINDKLLSHR